MARRGEGRARCLRGRARAQARRCRGHAGRSPRGTGRAAGAGARRAAPAAELPRLAPADPRGRPVATPRARASWAGDGARAARDGDRRSRGVVRRPGPRLRGEGDSLPGARLARASGVLRERRLASGSRISPASSTPKGGSCSPAGSVARASSASAAEHAVRRHRVLKSPLGLGRLAGEVDGLVGASRRDIDLVDRFVGRPETDAPRRVALRAGAKEGEIADPDQPFRLADRLLGRLHRKRVGAATPVAVEVDLSGGMRRERGRRCRPGRRGRSRARVGARRRCRRSGRRRRASTARRGRSRSRAEGRRRAGARASRSSGHACRACIRRRAGLRPGVRRRAAGVERGREVESEQVVLVLDLELEEALLSRFRRAEEHPPSRLRPPLRLLDEEEPRALERGPVEPRRCAFSSGEKRQSPSTSRAQAPRYSTRIQWSIRLAVAASDSSLALETAAQKARRSARGARLEVHDSHEPTVPVCKGRLTPL